MTPALRCFSLSLIFIAIVAQPALAQDPQATGTASKAADKAAAAKAAAGKAAADKPAADKAAATPLTLDNDQIYRKSLAALTILFVIAVLLENAFAVIFNWRVFLAYFSLRGVKTIIMIIVSLLIVNAFGVDVMASLIAAYKSPPPPNPPVEPAAISGPVSLFITALILAGGSAGVNRIMTALGFRSNRQPEDVVPRPPTNKAWVAVRVNRLQATSEVFVKVREIGPADATSPTPIAGAVGLKRTRLSGLLLRDSNRFPPNGGYTLSPNVVYSISVEAKDSQGTIHKALDDQNYVFAPGAIVDFEVAL